MASPGHQDFVARTHTKLAKELNQRFACNERREPFDHPDDTFGWDRDERRTRSAIRCQSPRFAKERTA